MCGIAGQFAPAGGVDADAVRRMTEALVHRGPDEDGFFADDCAALGFRRLSIIDLETGSQPIFNEDRSLALIFNGEIYNYRELRRELSGHRFTTQTDSEVVLHLFEELGVEAFGRLNGMFALAIYDLRRCKLYAARDRFGQKPLHYWRDARGGVIFASELSALRRHPQVKADLDPQALPFYWFYNYIPAPRSAFRGIAKLPPQHFMTADADGLTVARYDLPANDAYDEPATIDEAEERVDTLLREAVARHLIADVDVGVFLSGGLDSTLVLKYAVQAHPRIRAFSVTFGEHISEAPYARRACVVYGVKPEIVDVEAQPEDIEGVIAAYGEPFGDSAAIPAYLLSRHTRRSLKAVVTGEGGDELFGGYDEYQALLSAPPTLSLKHAYLRQRVYCGLKRLQSCFRLDLTALHAHLDALSFADVNDVMRHEQSQRLPDNHFAKIDTASMANSLEARCPLLDHALANYANRLPLAFKLDGQRQKILPKRILRRDLGDDFVDRPKRGFGAPVSQWLSSGPQRTRFVDVLHAESANLRELLTPEHHAQLLADVSDKAPPSYEHWKAYVLLVWLRANAIDLRDVDLKGDERKTAALTTSDAT